MGESVNNGVINNQRNGENNVAAIIINENNGVMASMASM
jgi:hypothetical protein